MVRPTLAIESELVNFLTDNPQWSAKGTTIVREIVADDFGLAVKIFNSIAQIAEAMDHHPDLFLYGWNKLRVILTTHDKGGITRLDFEMAHQIDVLLD